MDGMTDIPKRKRQYKSRRRHYEKNLQFNDAYMNIALAVIKQAVEDLQKPGYFRLKTKQLRDSKSFLTNPNDNRVAPFCDFLDIDIDNLRRAATSEFGTWEACGGAWPER